MVSKPLTVSIPHRLGRAEARRRLEEGLGQAHGHLRAVASSVDGQWTGDRLNFQMVAMAQTVTGRIDVMDETVLVVVELPWSLGLLANRLKDRLHRQGTLMLEKK